ncbi:MAG: M23 family metallopeptidase [Bacteroides sp.]|nr:M23 family metallopeptidase [Bacteroides sp.]MDE6824686.1 M23 family metallopeptidase [Duncaniella sp.]
MKVNLPASLLLISLAAAPVASADIVVFGNDTIVTDTTAIAPTSFDLILESMTEETAQRAPTEVLSTTLDYMSRLFDSGFIGLNKAGGLFDKGKVPEGDIFINVSEFKMPVRGPITSVFGPRKPGRKRKRIRVHRGVDIGIHKGDSVRAAFPGTIATTGYDKKGYGYYIIMSHPNGLQTLYAHLDSILVSPTATVDAGESIALGGMSGNSTGPHLHFETRYRAIPINPEDIIDFPKRKIHDATYVFNKETILRQQAEATEAIQQSIND